MGGIGNNLFQYLALLALKEKGYEAIMVRNLTEKNLITRCLGWTIHENIFSRLLSTERVSFLVFYRSIAKLVLYKLGLFDSGVSFDVLPKRIVSNIDLFGYFQSKEFISEHKCHFSELKQLFGSDIDLNLKGKLVIHFRWGDSDWAKKWSSYYDCLVSIFHEFEEVVVVSDDHDAALARFGQFDNVRIKKDSNAFNDFQFLMAGDHIVCAPSTFSWWASQLSASARVVYMPAFLFNKLGHHSKSQLRIINTELI